MKESKTQSCQSVEGDIVRPRLVVEVPIPARELWPNARPHWTAKAKAKKLLRTRTMVEAILAMHREKMQARPHWKRASVTATFFFRDSRRRDRDNCLAALKSAFDGLEDAGIVANDADFIYQPVQFGGFNDKTPRVVLLIESC